MSEQELVAKGIAHKVVKLDYATNARAIAMRKTAGFFKIIVTNDNGMRILGMRVIGEHASSAIQAVAYLIYTNRVYGSWPIWCIPTQALLKVCRSACECYSINPYINLMCSPTGQMLRVCENGVCTPVKSLV